MTKAMETLREAYREFETKTGRSPEVMRVGRELYDEYYGGILWNYRFQSTPDPYAPTGHRWTIPSVKETRPPLAFKATRVVEDGEGWAVRCGPDEDGDDGKGTVTR